MKIYIITCSYRHCDPATIECVFINKENAQERFAEEYNNDGDPDYYYELHECDTEDEL